MTHPIRPIEDQATLRTDGSVDQTQAYTTAEKIYDPAHPPTAYQQYPTTGSGSSTSVAGSTIAALNATSPTDGSLGFIRVGTWPDSEYVELVYDAVAGKWTSKPVPLIYTSDLKYMGTNTTTYSYISTDNAGVTTNTQIGVGVKPVRHAAELFAAGFTLQASMSCIMMGTTTPATFTVQAKFFQNNDAETVVFSADGSTAVGECGTALVSPLNNNITYRATGWANVVQNGLGAALTSTQVTKANLWPRLYGKISTGALFGSVIDTDLQVRWVA